jgi:YD repeat-containing protein
MGPAGEDSIAGSGSDYVTGFSYDSAENLTTISIGSSTESLHHPLPTMAVTAGSSYNADGQSTGTAVIFSGSSTSNSYSYDPDSQLTGSSGSSNNTYTYDLNGNPNSTGYTTGAGNEMTHSSGITYTYDNAGNMITATTASGTTTYTYDNANRVTNVDIHGTMAATYTYDALGRRIGIDDSGTQTWTVYNGKIGR